MRRLRILLICAFLLFTSTGVQSNANSNKGELLITKEPLFTIPEFNDLNESIEKQIKLNSLLDSLNYKK